MSAPDGLVLRAVNPLTKLAAAMVYVIAITVLFELRFQLALLALALLALLLLERVPPLRLAAVMAPFALMGFGYLWTNLLFHRESAGYLQSLGALSVAGHPGLDAGLIVFLRALNFGAVSYLFVRSTPPADLALGLMQRAGLPPALAFSVFTAVQFIPALGEDVRQLRMARRLRGGAGRGSWLALPRRYAGLIVPLLANAVRRAQRSAISMEARGLTRPMTRSYLRRSRFGPADVAFAIAAAAGLVCTSVLAFV